MKNVTIGQKAGIKPATPVQRYNQLSYRVKSGFKAKTFTERRFPATKCVHMVAT